MTTDASSTIKDTLGNATRAYLYENGKLSTLPHYNVHEDIIVPRSFPSLEAVKTFVCIANLRGCRYHVQNTHKDGRRISYTCKYCKAKLSFSQKGDVFHPTARTTCVCSCPRVGRGGNKMQRFPPDVTKVAIAALYDSGVTDIPGTDNATITEALRRDRGFLPDGDLAIRIKDEFAKVDPLRLPSHNMRVTEFSGILGDSGDAVCEVTESGAFWRSFVTLQRDAAGEVHVVRYVSDEQRMAHYAAFRAEEDVPFAWGSAALENDGDDNGSYGWFMGSLGAGCTVCPAYSCPNVEVHRVLTSNYSAFGTAYALYLLATQSYVPLGQLLRDPASPKHAIWSVNNNNNNNNNFNIIASGSNDSSPNMPSPMGFQPQQQCIYTSGSEVCQQYPYTYPQFQAEQPQPQPQHLQLQGVGYYLPVWIDEYNNDIDGNMMGWAPLDLSQAWWYYTF